MTQSYPLNTFISVRRHQTSIDGRTLILSHSSQIGSLFSQAELVEQSAFVIERLQLESAAVDRDVTEMVVGAELLLEEGRRGGEVLEPTAAPPAGHVHHPRLLVDPSAADRPRPLVHMNVPVKHHVHVVLLIERYQVPHPRVAPRRGPLPGVAVVVLVRRVCRVVVVADLPLGFRGR